MVRLGLHYKKVEFCGLGCGNWVGGGQEFGDGGTRGDSGGGLV